MLAALLVWVESIEFLRQEKLYKERKNKKPHHAAQLLYVLFDRRISFAVGRLVRLSISHVAYHVDEQVLADPGHALWRGSETPKHILSLLHQGIVIHMSHTAS